MHSENKGKGRFLFTAKMVHVYLLEFGDTHDAEDVAECVTGDPATEGAVP